jgi:MFS family permease
MVDTEFAQIKDNIAEEKPTAVHSWREILSQARWRHRVLLACGIQVFTQCSGTNIISNYNPSLYSSLGLKANTPLMIQGIWGALAQFWNTVFMLFIDRVGRRKLLIPSLLGMGATMGIEAALAQANGGYRDPSTANPDAVRAAIAMFFVFSIFFTSLGLISWLYQSEIFPTAIRARGSSLGTATNWSLNLIFAQCTPIARSSMGFNYFYCFFAFNWVAAVIVWAFYPETGGKSLEEVELVFSSSDQDNRACPLSGLKTNVFTVSNVLQ